jgi:Asp-tRNA(Asn)/Glu-tRNA(Gln) amidotransferase A subunit family amidase
LDAASGGELHTPVARERAQGCAHRRDDEPLWKGRTPPEVNTAIEGVIASMQGLGATVVRFALPEYDQLLPVLATDLYEARTVTEKYFSTLPANSPIKSYGALVEAKTSAVQKTLETEYAIVDGMNSLEYKNRMLNRDKLRLAVVNRMAELNLDAILYPHQKFWSCR